MAAKSKPEHVEEPEVDAPDPRIDNRGVVAQSTETVPQQADGGEHPAAVENVKGRS